MKNLAWLWWWCHLATVFIVTSAKVIPKKLSNQLYTLELKMPHVLPQQSDQYFCTATNVSAEELYLTSFEPDADATKIHHIIIFGCKSITKAHLYPNSWPCSHAQLCSGMRILYAWGRNAPGLSLPKDVGFHIGQRSDINYLVLQAHYAHPLLEKDSSGVRLLYTLEPQPFVAGIFLLASESGIIPPNKPKVHVDTNCRLNRSPINVFAYRVHAHALGSVITGYRYHQNSWSLIAKGNPQWPQAFYPMSNVIRIESDDILVSRCTFNSTGRATLTRMGSTAGDEMCNLYLMFYEENPLVLVDSDGGRDTSYLTGYRANLNVCEDIEIDNALLIRRMPEGNDEPPPRNITLEMSALGQHSHHGHSHRPGSGGTMTGSNEQQSKVTLFVHNDKWPYGATQFGQITAVDIDAHENVIIFHRGDHVWNELSFDYRNNYRQIDKGPISVPTIITLNPTTQEVIDKWGQGLFYMPHGLTIDHVDKALWLTDVALHQVFKYSIDPSSPQFHKPLLTLGKRFVPGSDTQHFCKPTSVAVDPSTGDFYIADGYCNNRIMRFNQSGVFLNHWGREPSVPLNFAQTSYEAPTVLNIPHKVVVIELSPGEKIVCVADRENGRIQCFSAPYGQFRFQIRRPEFNGRLFSITYSREDQVLYAVSGPSLMDPTTLPVIAFGFDINTQKPVTTFAPNSGSFHQPHDIAVSHSGDSVYVVEIGPNNLWRFTRDDYESEESDQTLVKSKVADVPKTMAAETPGKPVVNNAVIKSKMLEPKLTSKGGEGGAKVISTSSSSSSNINFNFELLRIRSKEFRESVTLNQMLYFLLIGLFLFLIVLHVKQSRESPFAFFSAVGRFTWRTVTGRGNSTRPTHHQSERIHLSSLFNERSRDPKRRGFNRLPQTEEESELSNVMNPDDDDDDSDVLEDFSLSKTKAQQRII